jgi:hypothetical protein
MPGAFWSEGERLNGLLTFPDQSGCNICFLLDHGCTGTEAKQMTKGRFLPAFLSVWMARALSSCAPFLS